MAEQSKPPGKCKTKTRNMSECEQAGSRGHSRASGSSGGGGESPRKTGGRVSSEGKQYSGPKWGSGSRHFSRTTRFAHEDDHGRNEGRETSRFRYSTHSSRFKGERWWEQGREPSRPSVDRGGTISDQNPPSKQWFKVTTPHGKMYDKEWLLSQIQDKCSVPFTPIEFHYENNKAHFFVEGANTASALKAVDHRIIDYDKRRVSIIINSSGPPLSVQNELKPQQVEQLKVIMRKKYDSSQKSLDLKGLRSDPELMAQNIDIVLSRKNFMSASIQIIGENIPQLLSLNMSNNRIYKLDDFSEILKAAPNLKILNLSSNELKSEQELNKVKGLQLCELWLEGNPLCKDFPDQSSYLSAIRKRFPKLLRLDGCELPPPIAFDIETPTTLLSCKGSYFESETIKGMVLNFLQHYYSVYDAENRQGLLDAYHEGACFSLSLPVSLSSSSRHNSNEYMENNRNIKKLKNPCLQFPLLKHSRLTVVAFLNELPKTQHDMNSFVVDVCAHTETLLCFSVHGIFKEIHEKSEDTIRAFTRVFVAVPSNNATGMCVVNDELCVRKANSEEIHNSFATPAVPTPAPNFMVTVIQQKQDMMQSFSMQSGMKLEWSQKCLEENNWDFAQAAQIFMQLKAEGKIPAVAFLK